MEKNAKLKSAITTLQIYFNVSHNFTTFFDDLKHDFALQRDCNHIYSPFLLNKIVLFCIPLIKWRCEIFRFDSVTIRYHGMGSQNVFSDQVLAPSHIGKLRSRSHYWLVPSSNLLKLECMGKTDIKLSATG